MELQDDVSADFAVGLAFPESATVVIIGGEVDIATAPVLREVLAYAETRHHGDPASECLVLDFSAVTFIDASGLGVLAGAARRSWHCGSRIVLRHPSHTLIRLLAITNLLGRFEIEPRNAEGADDPEAVAPSAAARRLLAMPVFV